LIWEPEKCTVVATYKRLVVGVALLSEPNYAYVTYLAVKAGWENAHIGTFVPNFIPSHVLKTLTFLPGRCSTT
jgi:hypothetical protein